MIVIYAIFKFNAHPFIIAWRGRILRHASIIQAGVVTVRVRGVIVTLLVVIASRLMVRGLKRTF